MADRTDLVEDDELQKEYEAAESRQSSSDAAAAAAGHTVMPPTRIIRSYDREVVEPSQEEMPPPYCDESQSGAAGQVSQQQQQQHRHPSWQQSAGYDNYWKQSNQVDSSNTMARPQPQQTQQPPAQQRRVTVIRVPANGQIVHVVRQNSWSPQKIRCAIALTILVVKVFVIIGVVIFLSVDWDK